MPGPGVVVNHQSHLHYWKGSLTSRHSPVAMWHSQLQKCWDCAYNSELWKYPIRNKRKKKGGKVGAMHSGLVEKLVGSRAPWQGSCLGVTKWQYTVCLSQLNRLCLPAPPLQCPASLDSQWPHLLLWHRLCSSVPSSAHVCVTSGAWCKIPLAKRVQVNSEGGSSTPAPLPQTSSSVLISPASETC